MTINMTEQVINPKDPNAEWFEEQEHANDIPEKEEVKEIVKEPGFVIIPADKPLNLHKPKNIGRQPWQDATDH